MHCMGYWNVPNTYQRIIEYLEMDPQKSLKSDFCPCTGQPQELHHEPESIVQMLLEIQQAWCCDCFPGETVPVPNHHLGEEPFPNICINHPWHMCKYQIPDT